MEYPAKIPGELVIAFNTKRHEFLKIFETTWRAKKVLTDEEKELLINAVMMTSEELWQMQVATAAALQTFKDLRRSIRGASRQAGMVERLLTDSSRGVEMPSLSPDDVRQHYKELEIEAEDA